MKKFHILWKFLSLNFNQKWMYQSKQTKTLLMSIMMDSKSASSSAIRGSFKYKIYKVRSYHKIKIISILIYNINSLYNWFLVCNKEVLMLRIYIIIMWLKKMNRMTTLIQIERIKNNKLYRRIYSNI